MKIVEKKTGKIIAIIDEKEIRILDAKRYKVINDNETIKK